jgi:hypothetical protein
VSLPYHLLWRKLQSAAQLAGRLYPSRTNWWPDKWREIFTSAWWGVRRSVKLIHHVWGWDSPATAWGKYNVFDHLGETGSVLKLTVLTPREKHLIPASRFALWVEGVDH